MALEGASKIGKGVDAHTNKSRNHYLRRQSLVVFPEEHQIASSPLLQTAGSPPYKSPQQKLRVSAPGIAGGAWLAKTGVCEHLFIMRCQQPLRPCIALFAFPPRVSYPYNSTGRASAGLKFLAASQ
eukprot:scaffold127881_cov17-Tisochrysis_lutea.AAC.1